MSSLTHIHLLLATFQLRSSAPLYFTLEVYFLSQGSHFIFLFFSLCRLKASGYYINSTETGVEASKDFIFRITIQHPYEVTYMRAEHILTSIYNIFIVSLHLSCQLYLNLTSLKPSRKRDPRTVIGVILSASPSFQHYWCLWFFPQFWSRLQVSHHPSYHI